ncbi:ABC-F family ATP-binding cassette domain-containing protein [Pectinatus sottacetonis]|uniref:ABC-F family ATP-binding cassette domain-containing protein n=1 Tax=Pectinatus sottacetonis TaxID=1002795 RepID=UPI0018C82521|nr:ABC-F family ATP-binding cassette domain-containing protein [Pectinatus sottacetonis]
MGLLRIQEVSKSFGIKELFNNVSFTINKGDKIGLIGANGAGKTTLLNCIMGVEDYDSGTVKIDAGDKIGYMEQQAEFSCQTLNEELLTTFNDVLTLKDEKEKLEKVIAKNTDKTKLADLMNEYTKTADEFERLDGYNYESNIRRVSFGLGFDENDLKKSPEDFSGGQKTRISLVKALLREPDYLFLDEPTNHLDIEMIEWLEEFLKNYKGGVLMISHDRFFLDKVTTSIAELINKNVDIYQGNYSRAMQLRNEQRAALESAFIKQQEHIKKTEEYIRRYKAGIKSKQARGREKQLKRLDRIILPPDSAGFNYLLFNPPAECAQKVLEIEDLAFSFGADFLFRDLSMSVRKGDGIALIGSNGAGKTTLLKLIMGELDAVSGRIKIGSRVKIGYFSQHHDELNGRNNIFSEIIDNYEVNDEQARNYLGAFLFKGDDVYKTVADLSGGEKARLALLKLMMDGANFLILDEPTNHLDIPAREAVERALMSFPGTFMVVSHDRYFLDKVTNCTYELEKGALTQYNGNYSYYRQKKDARETILPKQVKEKTVNKKNKFSLPEKKKLLTHEAEGSSLKAEKKEQAISRCEAHIAMLEVELKALEQKMNDPAIQKDIKTSEEVAEAYEAKQTEIDEKYKQWDSLMQ